MKATIFTGLLFGIGLLLSPAVFAQAPQNAQDHVKIKQTSDLFFPVSMVSTHSQGEAHVAINVDSQGVLRD
ncbi:MAG: hypothetical protein WC378_15855, partial [Opitutaceae bacterium]